MEDKFIAAHFFSILGEGNVYTLTPLVDASGHSRILVGSLQRKVYCLEYTKGKPCMREIPFTYIPAGAEIISMDAINRSVIQEDYIIGITIIKKDDIRGQQSQFFNIYSDWDLNTDSDLDTVSQNCLPLHLDYVPYHLYHTQARSSDLVDETVWLLSGSDCNIHLYQSDEEGYQEVNCSELFPEFSDTLDQVTLRINILYSSDGKTRMSAVCGEGGSVMVYRVCVQSRPNVTATHTLKWDYPVSSVNLFTVNTNARLPKILQGYNIEDSVPQIPDRHPTHTVVATSLESCYVFRDFPGSCDAYELPESDGHDVVSCCVTCDIDNDGENEIIIGTYEKSVIIYKRKLGEGEKKKKEDEREKDQEEDCRKWYTHGRLKVPCAVLALECCDMIGDGTNQLIVMTSAGTHIFQHNPADLAQLVLHRLERLVDIFDKKMMTTTTTTATTTTTTTTTAAIEQQE
ncbi:hypothetical protein Pmani_020495 [Petrolisthes manimaculis]|uniref:KICSTOR complex protein kaptin n=1 Tax=Petrolisthes manimaculis TaxID=1843537 RepID=A0AAE1U303_9EUCA|nr:hypothetical protein Pmani_020495 [Petrolisthes manimaculis]